jgi:adenylate cyclase class IV
MEAKNIKVKYELDNLTKCRIALNGLDTELIITESSLDIFFTYPSTPQKLVESYKDAQLHLQMNKINLIEQ